MHGHKFDVSTCLRSIGLATMLRHRLPASI